MKSIPQIPSADNPAPPIVATSWTKSEELRNDEKKGPSCRPNGKTQPRVGGFQRNPPRYQLTKGTPVLVRPVGDSTWISHRMRVTLQFFTHDGAGRGYLTFRHLGFQIQVQYFRVRMLST